MRRALIAAMLFAAAPAAAEPPPGSPPGIAPAVAMTDRPGGMIGLDASRKPAEVLAFLGVKRGDRVLDVMAGSGYYSEIIGNAIGSKGRVTALEPPVFLVDDRDRAPWTALLKRVPNVRLLEVLPGDALFKPASFDFVLMHLTYHDLYWSSRHYKLPEIDPAAFLATLFTAVRPGGIVGVVDHIADAGGGTRELVEKLHRIDPAVIKADFKAAGFVLEAESDLLRVPEDDHTKLVFAPGIRGRTDRAVLRFRRPR